MDFIVSEDFIVSDYIKPALESLVDPNQFGTISGSSTVLALISMIHISGSKQRMVTVLLCESSSLIIERPLTS